MERLHNIFHQIQRDISWLFLLCNNENISDVEIIVGLDENATTFRAHQNILWKNSVFKKLLEELSMEFTNGETKIIRIPDQGRRGVHLLLRQIYEKKLRIRSVYHALEAIDVGVKFVCPQLVKKCVIYLDKKINIKTVATIYEELRDSVSIFGIILPKNSLFLFSAEEMDDLQKPNGSNTIVVIDEEQERGKKVNTICIVSLLHNCSRYICLNADHLLRTDALINLDRKYLLDIVQSHRLNISSEVILFDALIRYSSEWCRRRNLKITPENQKNILGLDLIFSVRYLLMSVEEFTNGPLMSRVLPRKDEFILLAKIKGTALNSSLSSSLLTKEKLEIMSKPRDNGWHPPLPLCSPTLKCFKNVFVKENKPITGNKVDGESNDFEETERERENQNFRYTLGLLSTIFD